MASVLILLPTNPYASVIGSTLPLLTAIRRARCSLNSDRPGLQAKPVPQRFWNGDLAALDDFGFHLFAYENMPQISCNLKALTQRNVTASHAGWTVTVLKILPGSSRNS
jgi:hypothetical protein